MFSKPLAFVLLALGCLTAAAGGAYMAARHNAADQSAVAVMDRAAAVPATTPAAATAPGPGQPVAETEAAVSTPKPEPAPAVAEALPAEAPPPVSARPSARPAAKAPEKPAAVARTEPAESRTSRTAPIPGPVTPAPQGEAASTAPVPPAITAPPAKAPEPVKPVEEPQPEPVHVPQFEELILPASAVIGLQVETPTSTEKARVEDRVDARVSRDVMVAGRVAIPAGARVVGSVTLVERGGKIKEQARLGIRFHTLVFADGTEVPLQTEQVIRNGDAPASSSTKKIGGAAIGGAILGAILGGGKGAAAGGAIGAGAGTAAVMAGDRNAATLRQGEYLNIKLAAPTTVTVPRRED